MSEETLDWVVYDMTASHRYCPNECGPEFGPMTKAEARDLVSRKPDAYWATRLTKTN